MNNKVKERGGKMLKDLRERNNLTLLEVSLKLGYKYPSSYRKIEIGEQSLKIEQIKILANLFNCSEEKILESSYSN